MFQLFATTMILFTSTSRNRVDVEIKFHKRDANQTSLPSYYIAKIVHNIFLYPKAKFIFVLGP